MSEYAFGLQPYELIAALGGILLILTLILINFPKWLRISLLALILAGAGAFGFFYIQEYSAKPAQTESSRSIEKSAKPEAERRKRDFTSPGSEESVAISGEENEDYDTVTVLYGTDRTQAENVKRVAYSNGRGKRLELGSAQVTIPKNAHKTGEIERPFEVFGIQFTKEDPKKHFTIRKIGTLDGDGFTALGKQLLAKSKNYKDQAFVFIHGYNVSFDVALYRTAQMAYDLNFDGVPYMYSWPSVGGVLSYEYDQNSARLSRTYLREFLEKVTKESGAKDVHIVAHSMGNSPLLEVLRELNQKSDEDKVANINQIILAAPDVDRDVFEGLAKEIRGLGKGMTLYVSSSDIALKASRIYSSTIRAGDVPEQGPIIIKGMDTIDVSKVSTSWFSLNHSIYADSGKILGDITKLMLSQIRPPNLRTPELSTVNAGDDLVFWRYEEK